MSTNRRIWIVLALVALAGVWWAMSRRDDVVPVVAHGGRANPAGAAAAVIGEVAAAARPLEREPAPSAAADAVDAARIVGTVAGEDGAPIAGAEVWFNGFVGKAMTDAAGRFACAREPANPGQVALRYIVSGQRDYEDLLVNQWLPWGTRDLHFVLRRRVRVEVDLVDTEGKAVKGSVTLTERGPLGRQWVTESFDTDGLVFPAVALGPCSLVCSTVQRGLARPPRRELDVTGPCRVTVVFEPWAERRLVVVSSDGAPVEGSRVELLAPGESPSDRSRIRTDALGRATLRGFGSAPYTVRVTGRHAPLAVDGVRLDAAGDLLVRLPVDARLRVRLSPPGAVQQMTTLRAFVRLRRDGDAAARLAQTRDADTIEFVVEPGAWTLALVGGPLARTLANVVLGAGQATTLDVALPELVEAWVRPTVVCDQVDASRGDYVFLVREPPCADLGECARDVGLAARLQMATVVPAGRYRARLRRAPQALSDEAIELPPDGTVDARFRVRLGAVAIRLLDGCGEPRRDERIGLARDGVLTVEDELTYWTDGDGIVRSQCGIGVMQVVVLPPQQYSATTGSSAIAMELLRANVEPRTFVGTITVREGRTTEATFVLR